MSEKISKSPQIRFTGFTDAWEQRKAKELCTISTGKGNTQDKVEYGKYPFYVRSATIERSNDFLYDQEAVLTVGDGVGTGKVFHYVNGKYNLHQRVYRMYDFNSAVSAKYFYYYFSKNFYRRVMAMTAKTSVDSVRMEMIADMDITFPNEQEQKKIVDLFDDLDNTITLHQRKLELLKDTKKSLLQKMFPKDGANVPEIRFKGFTDAWEQRTFSELVTRVSKSSEVDELPRVEYEDIVSGQGKLNKDIFAKESDKKGIEFDVGYTLFGKLRPYLQNWLLADFRGIAVGDWWVLRPNEMDNKFIYSLIQSNKYQTVANLSTGTKMPRSDWNVVSQTEFSVPTDKGEQAKIGQLFNQLDHLITLHQRELNSLENLKKSLLQQMFI
ncbi:MULTISPECIES: restriction endonuclease subunit S [Bacillus]|uniref:restriction endonuclease subunit S n=1 Tax=Bacillus TaxID=1386 RepID=UPI0009383342|nr:restriction endonuclease subunit S [Bacillus altitudinis]APP15823.1 hypothetical protein BS467_08825 [Bacillus altitudinis]MBG9902039.1 hypothetical protein [Bacillus altitudinis]MBL7244119.1 restriction endonuclease subunit S [Bacillus altitudinis]SPR92361.1 conserved hypothetical protein [Bacillus altitudinis]